MADEQEITAPFETQALEAAWAAKAAARPKAYVYLQFGAKTDLGRVRENNEDKFDFLEPDDPAVLAVKGRVFAVADGMGGHSAGQVASELALNVFIRCYYSDGSPDVESCIQKAVREANAFVVETARTVPGRSGMGATLTAVVLRDDDLYIVQVGDSRCYLLRSGRLEQITEDHSWVAEQVRAGNMSLAEAEQSPFRNVITRSMGGAPEVSADVTAVKVEPGDRYLLCSDGLSGMVNDGELLDLLALGSPSVAAWNLVDRANHYGGKDNVTAMVLHVLDVQPWPEEDGDSASGAEEPEGVAAPAALNGSGGTGSGLSVSTPERAPAAVQASAPAETPAGQKTGFLDRLLHRH